MSIDQLINEYSRLSEEQRLEFDRRYASLRRFRRKSRELLKEMRRAGFEGAALNLNGRVGK